MQLRTPYNYDRDEVSKNTALISDSETLTQQNFKDETDLNIMIRKYGVLPVNEVNWKEFDATVIPKDYQELQNMMLEADKAFMQLPAEVRKAADNDPTKFLAMVEAEQVQIRKQEKEAKAAAAAEAKGSVEAPGQGPVADNADKTPE
jgi:hypothetical protein